MKDITILTPHTRVHTHTHSLTYIKLLFSLPTENVLYSDSTINIVVWPVECYKSGLLLIKQHRFYSTLLQLAILQSMDVRFSHDSISLHKQFSARILLPCYWVIFYLSSEIKIKSLPLRKAFWDVNRQSWSFLLFHYSAQY